MASGETATLYEPERPRRILALWIKVETSSGVDSLARRIARLRRKVPSCIRDFIVVTGKGLSGHEGEILVIVRVNQPVADREAFIGLVTEVRKTLKGNFREVRFPLESLCDPRVIYDDKHYNGWHAVKSR